MAFADPPVQKKKTICHSKGMQMFIHADFQKDLYFSFTLDAYFRSELHLIIL